MNKNVLMGVELGLIIAYLGLVLFVIPKKTLVGVIIIGVLTLLIFGIVLFLEKRREALAQEVEMSTQPAGDAMDLLSTPSSQPVQSTAGQAIPNMNSQPQQKPPLR